VLAQTYPSEKLEVIVVDDGSSDDTAAVARAYLKDAPMETQVMTVENGGPSRARNIGWRCSSGEWIQFLDDDDRLASSKIETQTEKAAKVSPKVAVVYSPWQRLHLNPQGNWKKGSIERPSVNQETVLRDLIASENFIATGSQLFSREWLCSVEGFEERYKVIEDVHLMLRIAMKGGGFEYVETNEPVFFYRQRDQGSLASDNKQAFVDGCVRNARLVEQYARENNTLTDTLQRQLIRVYFQGTRYYAGRDRERFFDIWKRIRNLNPRAYPERPTHLRMVSKILGYPAAERVAVSYRRLKSSLKGGSQS
jgi:glycosyltransferase involved in cell wall biosynthesis